jgi:hypothetical protein
MIDVLNCHCRPDSVTDAFTTLMSLFNDVQGDSKPIIEFRSRFDGMVMDMLRCRVIIPPLLLVVIFICALHSRYSDILDQFRSRYKDLDSATIDSMVADVKNHDSFQLVNHNKKTPKRVAPGLWLLPLTNQAKNGRILLNGSLPSPSKLLKLGGTALLRVRASAQSATVLRSLGMYQPIALC